MSSRPSQPAAAECIARLALAVAGLGDDAWRRELEDLGAPPPGRDVPAAPTYEHVATAGAATVKALVADDRWDAARSQADRLTALFRLNRHHLHPVAAESFDGLRAAVHARDREEVDDFLALLDEMFGGPADG